MPPVNPALQDMEVSIPPGGLPGILSVPANPKGVVVFAHGSGSSRLSPRNLAVAAALGREGLATLLFDLLTPVEARDRENVFDIPLLAARLETAIRYVRERPATAGLPAGLFGASTGAAAALTAAASWPGEVSTVVSRGGRPDLAGEMLAAVKVPVLLIVGERDRQVLELNRAALPLLPPGSELALVPGATHLFEEPGAMEEVTSLAAGWFGRRLSPGGECRAP
ncbi:MAG: dienelactone hydrolase family protein [Thermodesulfobacteriota bacterium]